MAYILKTEEDVKEYLQNIGTEYRFSCFQEKNAEGCHLLANYLDVYKNEYNAASNVYKMNCDEYNHPKSCVKYGNFCYIGRGIEQNFLTAFNYYKRSCDLNESKGCLYTGLMLTQNCDEKAKDAVEKNYVEGLSYLEKSCSSGDLTACFHASTLYLFGAEGIPKNSTKASQLSLLACNGKNIFACMNLSQMYRKGDGVEKDEKKAEEFKNRAKEIRDEMSKKKPIELQQHT